MGITFKTSVTLRILLESLEHRYYLPIKIGTPAQNLLNIARHHKAPTFKAVANL
jgi:hypothetical protein